MHFQILTFSCCHVLTCECARVTGRLDDDVDVLWHTLEQMAETLAQQDLIIRVRLCWGWLEVMFVECGSKVHRVLLSSHFLGIHKLVAGDTFSRAKHLDCPNLPTFLSRIIWAVYCLIGFCGPDLLSC